jgi:hypothetical protein|tara:strand:- start:1038 stop:1313 length:276 start_codon:yes stop_codon:yes gene_type:complete
MEKDIGSVKKNAETEVLIRVDDFGGKPGVTIREFVKSDRYTGFTKAGTRISAENFQLFKELVNSIDIKDLGVEEVKTNEDAPEKEFESPVK